MEETGITLIGAVFLAFALGFVWYSPFGFGDSFLEALGKGREELGSLSRVLGGAAAGLVASALLLDLLMRMAHVATIEEGAWFGLATGGVVAAATFADYLFCGRSLALFAIQATYQVVYLVLMGTVIGARP